MSSEKQQEPGPEAVGENLAKMVTSYVEQGIRLGTDWRNGLAHVITLRLNRLSRHPEQKEDTQLKEVRKMLWEFSSPAILGTFNNSAQDAFKRLIKIAFASKPESVRKEPPTAPEASKAEDSGIKDAATESHTQGPEGAPSESSDMLPCPFCGEEPERREFSFYVGVRCPKCFSNAGWVLIGWWNTRAANSVPSGNAKQTQAQSIPQMLLREASGETKAK